MLFQAVVVVAFAGTPFLLAQEDWVDVPIANPAPAQVIAAPVLPAYTPLAPGENFRYAFHRVFSPGKLFLYGVKASMDQERAVPNKWDEGINGWSERYADHFGRALIRENMAFGVRMLDGEDPRYQLSHEHGVWKRSKHAAAGAFVVRGRNGGLMPAWSRFLSDYATPFIAEQWKPEPFSAGRAFGAGTAGIAMAVASNLSMEFWPDVRRKLPRNFERHLAFNSQSLN
jgi:hypothetical protein